MPVNQIKVNPIWATPVWEVPLAFDKAFNQSLLNELQEIGKGLTNGTVIHDSLWDYDKPCLNELKKAITDTVSIKVQESIPEAKELNMTVDSHMCWPNIRQPNETMEVHAHTDATIAATYFVQAEEDCGDLVLFDTKEAIDWENGSLSKNPLLKTIKIKPKESSLVFFPSYVMHIVEKNNSQKQRVSITCDLKKVIDKSQPNAIVLKSWAEKMVSICLEN